MVTAVQNSISALNTPLVNSVVGSVVSSVVSSTATTARGGSDNSSATFNADRRPPQGRNVVGLVGRVMQQSDDLVVVFEYSAADGTTTRRVVSPIRFLDGNRFLGLCLSREEPRQFHINRCRNVRVDLAMNYVMPVEMVELGRE